MNAFQRKMTEHLSLIATLVMDINWQAKNLYITMRFHGHTNSLSVDINPFPYQPGKLKAGDKEYWNAFSMKADLDEYGQDSPLFGMATTEQIIHDLHLIRQALIEGRNNDEHYPATDSEHTATTGVDERNGTHGALLTEPAQLCHGSLEGTGGQSAGSIPSMA